MGVGEGVQKMPVSGHQLVPTSTGQRCQEGAEQAADTTFLGKVGVLGERRLGLAISRFAVLQKKTPPGSLTCFGIEGRKARAAGKTSGMPPDGWLCELTLDERSEACVGAPGSVTPWRASDKGLVLSSGKCQWQVASGRSRLLIHALATVWH